MKEKEEDKRRIMEREDKEKNGEIY